MYTCVCICMCISIYLWVPGRIQGLGCVPLHPWVRPCRSPPSHRTLEKEKRLEWDVSDDISMSNTSNHIAHYSEYWEVRRKEWKILPRFCVSKASSLPFFLLTLLCSQSIIRTSTALSTATLWLALLRAESTVSVVWCGVVQW